MADAIILTVKGRDPLKPAVVRWSARLNGHRFKGEVAFDLPTARHWLHWYLRRLCTENGVDYNAVGVTHLHNGTALGFGHLITPDMGAVMSHISVRPWLADTNHASN